MESNYDRSVGMATSYGLDNLGINVRSPGQKREFLLFHSFKINSEVHSSFDSMDVN
jgi:hypothetical protein